MTLQIMLNSRPALFVLLSIKMVNVIVSKQSASIFHLLNRNSKGHLVQFNLTLGSRGKQVGYLLQ